jgi:ABC-type molybdate transport system substrate-binding protein
MRVFLFLATLLLCVQGIAAEAAEVRVIATPALSAAFKVLGPQLDRATGHTLTIQYGLEVAQKQRIEAGDFDLAIVPSSVLDNAIKDDCRRHTDFSGPHRPERRSARWCRET